MSGTRWDYKASLSTASGTSSEGGANGSDDAVTAIREAVMRTVESYRKYEREVTMQGGDGLVTASSVADDLERNLLQAVIDAARMGADSTPASEGIDIDRIISEAVRLARMPSHRPDEAWLWHESDVVSEVKRLCLPQDRGHG